MMQAKMLKAKTLMPSRGQAHPQGPERLTVAAALAKWMVQEPERRKHFARPGQLARSLARSDCEFELRSLFAFAEAVPMCFMKDFAP
jgi:hypothetical protein